MTLTEVIKSGPRGYMGPPGHDCLDIINSTEMDLLSGRKIPSVFRITGSSCYIGLPKDYVTDPVTDNATHINK